MNGLAREIAQQLPYLRRYARAVTGQQLAGDTCVRHCLEKLLRDQDQIDSEHLRTTVFRTLNDQLTEPDDAPSGQSATPVEPPIEDGSILVRRIAGLDMVERRLLLLTALERFTLGQAAMVLRLEPSDAAARLDRAKQALRAQRATRILVIEDEPVIALDIATTVERNGHTVVGMAATHREAVTMARESRPGLVLADIQLADQSSGLEAVQEILREMDVPVIFITAYPERLLTGERPEPTFLITKPFDPDTLAVSIAQALATTAGPSA
jgi:CheY-like chemotaxis protein/DNA-directed RNA polymerase specialized sigma24 family protein